MTTQTRQQAIEALVKAADDASLAWVLEFGPKSQPVVRLSATLAAYHAAPALTREQVEDCLAPILTSYLGPRNRSLTVALTDALLPLLSAAGAMEHTDYRQAGAHPRQPLGAEGVTVTTEAGS